MKRTIYYHYNRLQALFHKLQSRLNKSFLSGRFKHLNKNQQYLLLQRLEKLKTQLSRMEKGLKYGSLAMATVAGLSLSPIEAIAQFAPAGAEFRVNTWTTGEQQNPQTAMDSDGDFVVTWASRNQDDPIEYGVYAQRYNAAGVAQGAEFKVNTYTTGRQNAPVIAMEDNGDFVIVWTSNGQDGNLGGVFGQRFNSTGQALGSEFQINTYTTGNQYSPAVAMDSDGDFVVTWSSSQGVSYDVYARRYDAAGAAVTGEFKVNTNDAGVQRFSTIGMDSNGDFIISWPNDGLDGSSYGIYAQRFNASGVAQGSEFRVNTYTTNAQRSQSVAMDGNGGFVIAWTSSVQDGSSDGIYAQRYNAAGVAQGAEFRVNTYTTGSQAGSDVTMDENGNFVISWESSNQDGSGVGIFAQRFNAAGVAQGAEFKVNTYTSNDQGRSSIAMDNDGDFIVTWMSTVGMNPGTSQDGSSGGIFAQRFEENFSPSNITLSATTIDENVATNTIVGTLSTTDPDNGNTFTYSLVSGTGSTDNASFSIADDKLQISVSPDFETKSSYSILVRSTDQDGLFFEKAFTITIANVNDAPTNIALSSTKVAENVAANTEVGTFTTSDADASNTFTYSFASGTGAANNASFAIVGDKLQIKISPDFETKKSYSIRIRSTDQDGLYFEKVITITITNVNEAPFDISLSSSLIAENVAANSEVGTFTTSDVDASNAFTYTLVTGTGDTDNALFAIVGDKLQINTSPDFETKDSYSIRVATADQGGLTFEKVFSITITDVNEAPIDIELNNSTIAENVAADTEIGTLTTTDEDAASTFTYSLVAGSGDIDNASFAIVGDKLQIKVSPDFEVKDSYNIRVRSTDQGGLFFEKEFTITITDVTETSITKSTEFSASIQLYPNPAKGLVQTNLEGIVDVRILDLSGHVVGQRIVSNKMINIEGIPAGVYMLEFTQNDKTGLKKLVIE